MLSRRKTEQRPEPVCQSFLLHSRTLLTLSCAYLCRCGQVVRAGKSHAGSAFLHRNRSQRSFQNKDPFSILYYTFAYQPSSLNFPDPATLDVQDLIAALRFDDPNNPNQPSFQDTFQPVLDGVYWTDKSEAQVRRCIRSTALSSLLK